MEATAEYKAMFAEEAKEHLRDWESCLLAMENGGRDAESINGMFRAIHTLKGSAGFLGINCLQGMLHELESSLQGIRDGSAPLEQSSIDLLFEGLDLTGRMVASFRAGEPFQGSTDDFLRKAAACSCAAARTGAEPSPAEPARTEGGPEPVVGSPVEAACGGAANRFEIDLRIVPTGREGFLRTLLVRGRLGAVATLISEDPPAETLKDSGDRFNLRLVCDTVGDEALLRRALNIDQVEILSLRPAVPEDGGRSAPPRAKAEVKPAIHVEEVVRVSVERLDTLLNLVGELVIQNSGFVSLAQKVKAEEGRTEVVTELEARAESLSKITRDLQDGIMRVRMLPVKNVFERFHRVVRDLSKDRKKKVSLEIFGEETEIDKKVMDRIGDPLVHLVRNAVDHGIESDAERAAAGKPPTGHIRLGAYQDGDHICIEVSDDGRGLIRQAIQDKAVEKGLLRAQDAAALPDERVLGLIFLPGFSTAREISEVSGRGVGMDVVKRAVEELGGAVRVRSSVGHGTTVSILLPLTMAIISTVQVEVDGSLMAIPLSAVKEVLKVREGDLASVGGRAVIQLRDEVLAVISLPEALDMGAGGEDLASLRGSSVVIVENEGKKIGFAVDRVTGTGEIVIKSLSRHYREIEGLIGASILGNGNIALIVDVETLVKRYHWGGGERSGGAADVQFTLRDGPSAPPQTDAAGAPTPPAAQEVGAEHPMAEGEEKPAAEGTVAERPTAEARPADDRAAESGPDAETVDAARSALLENVHNAGAIQASVSVSSLLGRDVQVSFPESELVRINGIAETLGGEEKTVGGVYVAVEGDLQGGMLLVIPEDSLLGFHDLLYHQSPGTTAAREEVDLSAVSELGNVLTASFLNSLADEARLAVKPTVPEIRIDMCQAVLDSVLARFNQPGEQILVTKTMVQCESNAGILCHLLMFLQPDSLLQLRRALALDRA